MLDSLLPQVDEFKESVEIILIDDGSTDKSMEIINKINEKKILKVIKQKNQGVSTARNNGILAAKGEFITFLDGDDFVEKSYLKVIMSNLKENKDIYIYPFYYFKNNTRKLSYTPYKDEWLKTKNNERLLYNLVYQHKEIHSVPWNKVYKKKIITGEKIFFENKKFFEDIFFNLEYFFHSKSIKVVNIPIVNYVQRDGSITKSYDSQIFESQKNILNKLEAFSKKNNLDCLSQELFEVFDIRLSLYTYIYLYRQKADSIIKIKYKNLIKNKVKNYKNINKSKLPLKHRLLILYLTKI